MVIVAAKELAAIAREKGLKTDNIIPTMLDWEAYQRVATAVGNKAQQEGISRKSVPKEELYHRAKSVIEHSRKVLQVLVQSGMIPDIPPSASSKKASDNQTSG